MSQGEQLRQVRRNYNLREHRYSLINVKQAVIEQKEDH